MQDLTPGDPGDRHRADRQRKVFLDLALAMPAERALAALAER